MQDPIIIYVYTVASTIIYSSIMLELPNISHMNYLERENSTIVVYCEEKGTMPMPPARAYRTGTDCWRYRRQAKNTHTVRKIQGLFNEIIPDRNN